MYLCIDLTAYKSAFGATSGGFMDVFNSTEEVVQNCAKDFHETWWGGWYTGKETIEFWQGSGVFFFYSALF